jgi:hypothetical protein
MLSEDDIMLDIKINNKEKKIEDDLGFILWKLESLEDFYPCYKSIMTKE